MDKIAELTLKETSDKFRQFSRNGRWGTCGYCPQDNNGNVYPEFCKDTDRYDHQLSNKSLHENYDATYNRISQVITST